MAVTVVFTSKVPVRKKLIKQFKSNESAKRAVEALSKKFKAVWYQPKPKKRSKKKR